MPNPPLSINHQAFSYYARLRRVKEYVDQHFSEDMSLGAVAQVAGLSEKYFSEFFHKKTGVPFRTWLNWVRINRAVQMLKVENYNVSTVAFAVGYHDLRTFGRAFKKYKFMTPRAFKRIVQPR